MSKLIVTGDISGDTMMFFYAFTFQGHEGLEMRIKSTYRGWSGGKPQLTPWVIEEIAKDLGFSVDAVMLNCFELGFMTYDEHMATGIKFIEECPE